MTPSSSMASGKRLPGAVCAAALGLREVREIEAPPRDRRGEEDAALAPPAPQQRREDRHRPGALRVVAVPGDVPPGVDGDGRLRLAHRPRRLPDLRGGNLRDRLGPFRRELPDVRRELDRTPWRTSRCIRLSHRSSAIRTFIHARRSAMSVPGPDRQPPVGLGRGGREARVDGDQLRAAREAGRERGDLGREHVLAQMASDQDDEPRLLEIDRLGRAEALPERERVAHLPRAAALGEGRLGAVRRAVGAHQGREEARAVAVREEGDALRAVLVAERLEARGEKVERLVPARRA